MVCKRFELNNSNYFQITAKLVQPEPKFTFAAPVATVYNGLQKV